jgi:hypothetical protein
MGQADSIPNTSRLSFSSAGALPPQARARLEAPTPEGPALPASPRPLAQSIGSGFMPVIYHPERTAEYLRFERIIRKAKATPDEALTYAGRVIWYRERQAADKRRHLEALQHPRYFLEAAE